MRKLLWVPLLPFLIFLSACGGSSGSSSGGGSTPTLQMITVTSSATTVPLGTTQQLSATGHYSDGSSKDLTSSVTWTPATYFVSATPGLFKATGTAGTTVNATATFSGTSGELAITLGPPNLLSIAVSPSNASIALGLKQQFKAQGTYSDNSSQDVTATATWSSSTASVATIAAGGLATSVGPGTTTITATSAGVNATAVLTVTSPALVSITVAPASKTLFAGQTQQYTASGTYTDSSTKDLTSTVTWNSSNPAAASIASAGLATAVAAGVTSISASTGGLTSNSATLTVNPAAVVSIAVTPTAATVAHGFSQQFTAMATLTDGTTANVTSLSTTTWNSDNIAVATISNSLGTNGLATGVTAGAAHITAVSSNGVSGSVTSNAAVITVTDETLVSIDLTPTNPTISLASFQQFKATGHFSKGSQLDLTATATWNSSQTNVARVAAGQANGVGLGTTTITATQAGVLSNPASLTVDLSGLDGLTIQPASAQIALGTTEPFKAIATFLNGATLNVTTLPQLSWSSDNSTVASVGQHTGAAKASNTVSGTANITAALSSFSPSAPLTVSPAIITSITVTPTGKTIAIGTSQPFTAEGTFSDSTTQTLVNGSDVGWMSSDTTKVTISQAGLATGLANTSSPVTITANFLGVQQVSGSALLNVCGGALQSIAITPLTYILAPASSVAYNALGTYAGCSSLQSIANQVAWNSSNTNVATFAGNTATGLSQGSSTITASLSGITSNSSTLIVEGSPLVSIGVSPSAASIPQQIKTAFKATGAFQDGNTQDLTSFVVWSANPNSIATISNASGSQGQALSGSTEGTATITAAYSGLSGQASLSVTRGVLNLIVIVPSIQTLHVGQTQQFRSTGTFTDDSTLDLTNQVTWTSDNGAVLVISNGGLATAIAPGRANVTASLNGIHISAGVTVIP